MAEMSKIENLNGGFIINRAKTSFPDDMPHMHAHNYHELYFLISGTRRYFIGHTIYNVFAGDLVIVPKGELHQTYHYHSSGHERYVTYFSDAYTKALRDAAGSAVFEEFLNSGCISLPSAQSEKIKTLFSEIERECSSGDSYSHLITSGKLNEILTCALRHGTPRLRETEKTAERIQKVAQYISENFAESITLHEAAQMAYMEDTYFSRQFKKLTGFGFVEYLTQVRVKTAAQMLSNSTLSINKIAERCGFAGSNYFGDVFKRLYGMSPVHYRKTAKNDL